MFPQTTTNKKTMTRFSWFIILLLISSLSWAASKAIPRSQTLNLYIGSVKVMKIPNIERVAVGNSKLLSTSLTSKGQLIILPEKYGETTIHIWGKPGWERKLRVKISKNNPTSAVSEIQSLLQNSLNLNVRTVGGRPVIDGLASLTDKPRLDIIKKIYPDAIIMARTSNVMREKMIHMKVQITEFSSSALEELGIDWQTAINGPALGFAGNRKENPLFRVNGSSDDAPGYSSSLPNQFNGSTFGFFGIATEITSRINFLVANGDALTLASPNLTARSGGEAEFLSGGEIPIVNEFANGSSVEYKEYGIKLKINPSADNNGNITARVETEISAIDPATTVDDIPGFLSRKTSADLSMRDGETIVISKLINSNLSKDTSGLKYLSSIPILGSLFRNKNLRDRKTELVIFVTPSVITADSKINKESLAAHDYLIKRFKEATDYKDWADKDSPNGDLLD